MKIRRREQGTTDSSQRSSWVLYVGERPVQVLVNQGFNERLFAALEHRSRYEPVLEGENQAAEAALFGRLCDQCVNPVCRRVFAFGEGVDTGSQGLFPGQTLAQVVVRKPVAESSMNMPMPSSKA